LPNIEDTDGWRATGDKAFDCGSGIADTFCVSAVSENHCRRSSNSRKERFFGTTPNLCKENVLKQKPITVFQRERTVEREHGLGGVT
jgi:hypothetical protein